ncbi:hypothetical protein P171DRAFT_480665 [Karstenula rhodostoma CBS 690.94]|uniref:Uncharacterized protein n=1 Tax=Karstenula rhodostoma CBS 690.94 TaxID=1392251 RepID=A0A9P4UGH7_9PLEO|nr:hypothetical protein P171DRAFT_480665 [Karstenula rhodostoma CBS 690.94]
MREHTYEAPFFYSPYSIYRGAPSPEVDAAWEAIEYPAQMHFSREEIIKLGKDTEAAAKLPEEWGPYLHLSATFPTLTNDAISGYGNDRYFGPSLNVFTYYWMDSQPDPSPDFEINGKCQNHGELLEWQKAREIAPDFRDLHYERRPLGAKVSPAKSQLAKVEGWVWNGSAPI